MANLADRLDLDAPVLVGPPGGDVLSHREEEILRLITQGHTNQEIAETLFIALNTVKTHIRSLYHKIGVTSRTHAVLWGVRHGYLDAHQPLVPPRGDC